MHAAYLTQQLYEVGCAATLAIGAGGQLHPKYWTSVTRVPCRLALGYGRPMTTYTYIMATAVVLYESWKQVSNLPVHVALCTSVQSKSTLFRCSNWQMQHCINVTGVRTPASCCSRSLEIRRCSRHGVTAAETAEFGDGPSKSRRLPKTTSTLEQHCQTQLL